MRVAVLQSNYLPWKGYFDIINSVDVFVYYDEVQYTKNDWRNRNKLYGKNGEFWLTIPIHKDAVKQKISQVRIENPFWQEQHFKSIYLTYKRSPFFHQIEPLIHEVYIEKKWELLIDIDRYFIEKIARIVGIQTKFIDSKNFDLQGDRVERLVSLLKQVGASSYISGPSAKDYLAGKEHIFAENNIDLLYKSYIGYKEYPQLCSPFLHGVSVIDVLANVNLAEISQYLFIRNN
ncbi:WbqC family protein [Thermoflexibacter ruber]|uniref:WbqC-like protein family protein n=1 Tax=Thermoflexibacter ruber TaxID=1003 RepID=A0A1I2HHX1_9BACT|nr:WbqC family protein [Thermoflexibacter ruber]SFF28366.1 WbqC-like protein family protein [Thermoflexibacter ruber]